MHNSNQSAVFSAIRKFMNPIVRLLIKNGVGYQEFSEICKATFVEIASDEYGIRGRKTNMSRVAVMTGLSRKEVRKIRDALAAGKMSTTSRTRRPELVLSIWHTNPAYLDRKHKPKRIRFDGPGATFCELVSRVGGDIPPRAMLIELLRAGSVVEEGEKLRAVSRSYIPEPDDPDSFRLAGDAIHDLVATIHHNLSCDDPDARYLQRYVYTEKIHKAHQMRFRKLAKERGQLLLQDLNSWLAEREHVHEADDADGQPGDATRTGVGVYYFSQTRSRVRSNGGQNRP